MATLFRPMLLAGTVYGTLKLPNTMYFRLSWPAIFAISGKCSESDEIAYSSTTLKGQHHGDIGFVPYCS